MFTDNAILCSCPENFWPGLSEEQDKETHVNEIESDVRFPSTINALNRKITNLTTFSVFKFCAQDSPIYFPTLY